MITRLMLTFVLGKVSEIQPDADREPGSTRNFTKNENNSTKTVPFLEECGIIDSDKAELIVFDVSSEINNSESLSDWHPYAHLWRI